MAATKSADGPIPKQEMHFLVSTDIKKPNPELRKFIRSYVMQGKNRRKYQSFQRSKSKRLQNTPFLGSSASPTDVSCLDAEQTFPSASSTTAMYPILQVTIPRKFGSDVSTVRFADNVESGTVEMVLKFSSIAKKILCPLDTCILFEGKSDAWIAPLAVDSAYLHAMIFTSQFYFDVILSQKPSSFNHLKLPHLLRAIRLLRERVSRNDDQARLSNTTAAAIMALASHAHMTGDSKSAKHHMNGLCKITSLRGGVTTFSDHPKLLVQILGCDIGMSLCSGSKPVFFNNTCSTDLFLPYPDLTLLLNLEKRTRTDFQYDSAMLDGIDEELARAWGVMSHFSLVINFAVDSGQLLSAETFVETMASVIYRLLVMRFKSGSRSESIRLGLLAFSSNIFLQWKHLGMDYPHLASAFKGSIVRLISTNVSSQFMLWLLMVGAVSVFGAADDQWLESLLYVNMSFCGIDSWNKMRDLLQSFIWIGLVYDKHGKSVFESVIAKFDSHLPDL